MSHYKEEEKARAELAETLMRRPKYADFKPEDLDKEKLKNKKSSWTSWLGFSSGSKSSS